MLSVYRIKLDSNLSEIARKARNAMAWETRETKKWNAMETRQIVFSVTSISIDSRYQSITIGGLRVVSLNTEFLMHGRFSGRFLFNFPLSKLYLI